MCGPQLEPCAGLYGPGRIPLLADIVARKPIAGAPDAHLNLIHVDDAARAVVAAAVAGHVNQSDVRRVRRHAPNARGRYVGLLAKWLGVPPPLFKGGCGLGKRVRNTRVVHELGLRLKYASYRDGLVASWKQVGRVS